MNVAIPSYQRPFFHNVTERIEWETAHGSPKLHNEDHRLGGFDHFYPS